ncbi:MAG TPA: glycosyltransferase family 1 protein [Planctomycetota bacterium]
MRVGFDVSPLTHPHSRGLARVVEELVAALERRARLEVVRLAPGPGHGSRRWRQGELPRHARGLAGLHSFTSAFALRGPGARVQTIHELPWKHGVAENADLRHRLWASLGARRATRVVVPSAHVARDLGAAARRKATVVPWGVAQRFVPEPAPGQVDEVVRARYRLGEDPYLFCPGAVRAKKNLAAVLQALAERRARGAPALRVLVTGGDSPQLRQDLGLASRLGLDRFVMVLDEAAEEDLPALYRLAAAVPVLSLSEGFGLPVLEALACGTPVLVPPDSAQAEVAGAAGLVVEPARPAEVARALEQAVAERTALAARGLERARAFTWEAAAERVEALWQELA